MVAVLAGCACLDSGRAAAADLEIYFVDVLGGAATLVVTPERETILVDSGWPGQNDRDPERIVKALKDAGCDRIDHLVTTHWHMDHYGGVAGLAKRAAIGRFWDRGLPEDGEAGAEFPDGPKSQDPLGVAYRDASKGKRSVLKAGDSLPLRGTTTAVVLAASGKVLPAPTGAPANASCESAAPDHPVDESDNARSVVLKLRQGAFEFLDCGDLTWNIEKSLVCPVDLVGKIDLFQVTHHGMDISNNPDFLRTIAPVVTIMDNGPRKGGAAETVRRIKAIPSVQAAYQLHKNAQTAADQNTDPSLIANTDPAGGRYIRVAVPADGKTFRVRMGSDGPERTFESQ
ncbi:ComEC/Rec2 family competence protein [Paludisphaera rhizosphaerae]|uniref:ComEC/Rec2 family competence protein n=1 Tax=Paludisphaera rhizosphaerae TaxID=2711216 RepID=UPI001F10860B|nr:MBL fold metallo-hydrolase [Paludisphaera rhizosphaerae]